MSVSYIARNNANFGFVGFEMLLAPSIRPITASPKTGEENTHHQLILTDTHSACKFIECIFSPFSPSDENKSNKSHDTYLNLWPLQLGLTYGMQCEHQFSSAGGPNEQNIKYWNHFGAKGMAKWDAMSPRIADPDIVWWDVIIEMENRRRMCIVHWCRQKRWREEGRVAIKLATINNMQRSDRSLLQKKNIFFVYNKIAFNNFFIFPKLYISTPWLPQPYIKNEFDIFKLILLKHSPNEKESIVLLHFPSLTKNICFALPHFRKYYVFIPSRSS